MRKNARGWYSKSLYRQIQRHIVHLTSSIRHRLRMHLFTKPSLQNTESSFTQRQLPQPLRQRILERKKNTPSAHQTAPTLLVHNFQGITNHFCPHYRKSCIVGIKKKEPCTKLCRPPKHLKYTMKNLF